MARATPPTAAIPSCRACLREGAGEDFSGTCSFAAQKSDSSLRLGLIARLACNAGRLSAGRLPVWNADDMVSEVPHTAMANKSKLSRIVFGGGRLRSDPRRKHDGTKKLCSVEHTFLDLPI